MRVIQASPGGKLAPQSTEGERESLGLNCDIRTDNHAVSSVTPLQSLRDSFPSGDACIVRIRSARLLNKAFLKLMTLGLAPPSRYNKIENRQSRSALPFVC